MKKIISTIVLFSIVLSFSFAGGGKEEGGAEKKLVLYSAHKEETYAVAVEPFEAATGIDVEVIVAGTGELMARIRTESANPNADVFWGGTVNNFLPELDNFQEYVSPNEANSEELFRNHMKKVTRTSIIPSVIIVNKKVLAELTGPNVKITGYQSIIDAVEKYPQLKGRISNANPSKSSSAYEQLVNQIWAFAYIEAEKDLGRPAKVEDVTQKYIDRAMPHVKKLVATYDGNHSAGSTAAMTDVVQGETAIGLTHEGNAEEALSSSDDIAVIYPEEGAVVKAVGAGIIKGAKHLENAKLFIDFLLTAEFQNGLTTIGRRPLMKGADLSATVLPPVSSFKIIKDNIDLNNKEAFIETYNGFFRGE